MSRPHIPPLPRLFKRGIQTANINHEWTAAAQPWQRHLRLKTAKEGGWKKRGEQGTKVGRVCPGGRLRRTGCCGLLQSPRSFQPPKRPSPVHHPPSLETQSAGDQHSRPSPPPKSRAGRKPSGPLCGKQLRPQREAPRAGSRRPRGRSPRAGGVSMPQHLRGPPSPCTARSSSGSKRPPQEEKESELWLAVWGDPRTAAGRTREPSQAVEK